MHDDDEFKNTTKMIQSSIRNIKYKTSYCSVTDLKYKDTAPQIQTLLTIQLVGHT